MLTSGLHSYPTFAPNEHCAELALRVPFNSAQPESLSANGQDTHTPPKSLSDAAQPRQQRDKQP